MTIEKYLATLGSGYTDEDAEVIGPELTRLAGIGLSTTRDIAHAAKSEHSPLHRFIYADSDAEAAEKHRIHLAGHMARSIRVTLRLDNGTHRQTRAFYPVRVVESSPAGVKGDADDRVRYDVVPVQRAYLPITTITEDVDLAGQVRDDLWRQLVTWRSRARDFDDFFSEIVAAIEKKKNEFEVAA